MTQATLDEALEGERLKAEGMRRAELAEPEMWKRRFRGAAFDLARVRSEITSDDVLLEMGSEPLSPGITGALMNGLAAAGVIEPTGRYVKSDRPSRHRAVIAVWRAGPRIAAAPRAGREGVGLATSAGTADQPQGGSEHLRSA